MPPGDPHLTRVVVRNVHEDIERLIAVQEPLRVGQARVDVQFFFKIVGHS